MSIINGKSYDWADVDVQIPGLYIEVQEISYDDELEKELVYGRGNRPRGYGSGNYKASGKISLLRDDYNDLIGYCKKLKIPFYKLFIDKIVVTYGSDGQPMKTDVIEKVTFAKRSGGGKQGDKSLTVDLDMVIVGQIISDGVKAI
jgi:hypothetical protein